MTQEWTAAPNTVGIWTCEQDGVRAFVWAVGIGLFTTYARHLTSGRTLSDPTIYRSYDAAVASAETLTHTLRWPDAPESGSRRST